MSSKQIVIVALIATVASFGTYAAIQKIPALKAKLG